jgi:hypothetical protein
VRGGSHFISGAIMNLHLRKKDRQIHDAQPAPAALEQELDELNLAGAHTLSFPFFDTESYFVSSGQQPVVEADSAITNLDNAGIELAENTEEPIPIADAETHNISADASTSTPNELMFKDIVSIINECDREFQGSVLKLQQRCDSLAEITNDLVSGSVECKEQIRLQAKFYQNEMQKGIAAQQEMLTEMFYAIDKKIEELTTRIVEQEKVAIKSEAETLEIVKNHERKFKEFDNRHSQNLHETVQLLENRIAELDRKLTVDQQNLRQNVTHGLINLANSFERTQPI